MACCSILIALTTLVSSVISRTIIPETRLPQSSLVCAPYVIPEVSQPNDYANCAFEVAKARRHQSSRNKPTSRIVRDNGYIYEGYEVTSPDGYILTLDRIPGGNHSPPVKGKKAVLLAHGLFGAGDNWLIGSKNLVFRLVDDGFDVWLSNNRGTSYSNEHTKLDPDFDLSYWDFSWHEMGAIDLPVIVDKIIEITKKKKIMYVGYSMGTTSYFVGLSSVPELNDKIEVGILLAPIAYMGRANNAVRIITPVFKARAKSPRLGKIQTFQHLRAATNISYGEVCDPVVARCGLCKDIVFLFAGFNPSQIDYENLPTIFTKCANTASFKTFVHYSQLMNSCKFHQYDYGRVDNLVHYGKTEPPEYQILKITTPTYLFHGEKDNFCQSADVKTTASHMREDSVTQVFVPKFNHLDIAFGRDTDTHVFNHVHDILSGRRQYGASFEWKNQIFSATKCQKFNINCL